MKVLSLFFLLSTNLAFSQNLDESAYHTAFAELNGMLNDTHDLNFKRAVFITENAYLDNKLDYSEFDSHIQYLAKRCLLIASQTDLIYSESDKEKVEKLAAVFKLMTDTVTFYRDSSRVSHTLPYRYDFDDLFAELDWKKMFVTKLLSTHKGNCHSLPFLYKILCEEINVKSYLAMAPNHTYIKTWCKKTGWYNTELTSGYFPLDAWIMASGYVHLKAVQNRVYMDTLSDKQSIAVCLIDLAKGYERKFGARADLTFIKEVCDLALQHYPNYLNAHILKAETLKKGFELEMTKYNAQYPSDLFNQLDKKKAFDEMQGIYLHVHELGFRKMPKEMYISWLSDVQRQREKYQNKEIQKIK